MMPAVPAVPPVDAVVELPDRKDMDFDERDQLALTVIVETWKHYRKQGEAWMQELANDAFGDEAPQTVLGAKMRWQWLKLLWGKRKEYKRLIAAGVPPERADFDAIALGPNHPWRYLNTIRADAIHWWPRVEACGVPMPRTIVVDLGEDLLFSNLLKPKKRTQADIERASAWGEKVGHAANEIGYPLFVRSGSMSGKHAGPMMYRARNEQELWFCIQALIQATGSVDGVPFRSIMLREWLDLDGGFYAFGAKDGDAHLIAREYRAFTGPDYPTRVDAYWPLNAMQFNGPEPQGWREILAKQNILKPGEEAELCRLAEQVGKHLDGNWSIDFAKARDGRWFFIDCAPAELSHDHRAKTGVAGVLNSLTDKDMEPMRQLYRDEAP